MCLEANARANGAEMICHHAAAAAVAGTGCMTRPVPIALPPGFIDAHPELKAGEGA